jgi:hypothetical protein
LDERTARIFHQDLLIFFRNFGRFQDFQLLIINFKQLQFKTFPWSGKYRKHSWGSIVAKEGCRIWRPDTKPSNFGFSGPKTVIPETHSPIPKCKIVQIHANSPEISRFLTNSCCEFKRIERNSGEFTRFHANSGILSGLHESHKFAIAFFEIFSSLEQFLW